MSEFSLRRTLSIDESHAYKVLSSAKLQMSDSRFENKRSFINMLNNIGPSIEPCGTPKTMASQVLPS